MSSESVPNVATPNAKLYYPFTNPAAGTALCKEQWPGNETLPLLFQPILIGKTAKMLFHNRIFVSPMCQYSCEPGTGLATAWHLVHLGSLAVRGPALVMTEAAAVTENGRISPEDLGIWSDAHMKALVPIVDFIHSQGTRAGIQLSHAGRKASTMAMWLDASTIGPALSTHVATTEKGNGWTDVVAPSAIPYLSGSYPQPRAMTIREIEDLKTAWGEAVVRADQAGFDVIELHEFLSPLSNHRTDQYGGSLANRMRLPLELIQLSRTLLSRTKPLFLRLSATDWHPKGEKDPNGNYISWGEEQSSIFLNQAIALGVDLADISSAGLDSNQQIPIGPGYQVPLAKNLKRSFGELQIPLSSVGMITSGIQAESILQSGDTDIISVGREFLRNLDLVFDWAVSLGIVVNVPVQYQRGWSHLMKKFAH